MKQLLFFGLIAAFALQSCTHSHMFSKRKYGHLNWIDHDTKVETVGKGLEPSPSKKQQTLPSTESEKLVPEKTEISATPVENLIAPAQIKEPENNSTKSNSYPESKNDLTQTPSVEQENPVSTPTSIQEDAKTEELRAFDQKKPLLDGDGLLILCIVLCFFIPPLAMYVWNKSTDSLFILDLVLFLLWIFLILGFAFGFIALAAIIIALLRVLDII